MLYKISITNHSTSDNYFIFNSLHELVYQTCHLDLFVKDNNKMLLKNCIDRLIKNGYKIEKL